ncbi:hypothetical protein GQ457_05G015530 [Hibiscus cannabinus]
MNSACVFNCNEATSMTQVNGSLEMIPLVDEKSMKTVMLFNENMRKHGVSRYMLFVLGSPTTPHGAAKKMVISPEIHVRKFIFGRKRCEKLTLISWINHKNQQLKVSRRHNQLESLVSTKVLSRPLRKYCLDLYSVHQIKRGAKFTETPFGSREKSTRPLRSRVGGKFLFPSKVGGNLGF